MARKAKAEPFLSRVAHSSGANSVASFNISFYGNAKKDNDFKRMPLDQFMKEMKEAEDELGKTLAEMARAKMFEYLKRGGTYNIGDTGKSAENLYVGSTSVDGHTVWYVAEGTKTKATRFIRTGTQGASGKVKSKRKNKGKSGNKYGLISKLNVWAKHRHLTPRIAPKAVRKKWTNYRKSRGYDGNEDAMVAAGTKDNFRFSGKPSGRRALSGGNDYHLMRKQMETRKPDQDRWDKMLWGIYWGIKKHGTAMSYKRRFGNPWFDYPEVYASSSTTRDNIRRLLEAKKTNKFYKTVMDVAIGYVGTTIYKRMGMVQRYGQRTIHHAWAPVENVFVRSNRRR